MNGKGIKNMAKSVTRLMIDVNIQTGNVFRHQALVLGTIKSNGIHVRLRMTCWMTVHTGMMIKPQ